MTGSHAVRETGTQLEDAGYAVIPDAVAPGAVSAALRLLNLAIRRHGLSASEIAECQQTTFFPHLRWEPEVWGVLPGDAGRVLGLRDGDEWAEPQLLMRFPDEMEPWPVVPHVDEPPAWAGGRPYRGIVAVALTDAGVTEGVPCVWPGSHRRSEREMTPDAADGDRILVSMKAGDALVMHPALQHAGTLNLGARVRHAVYFRLIASS
jgi:hypothetical protein